MSKMKFIYHVEASTVTWKKDQCAICLLTRRDVAHTIQWTIIIYSQNHNMESRLQSENNQIRTLSILNIVTLF